MQKYTERWWDTFSIACLLVMLFFVASSLELTQWVNNLNHITALMLLGGILGILLGLSLYKKRIVIILSTLYSVVIIPWQIIFTVGPNVSWNDKLLAFFGRIGISSYQLINGVPLEDGILFFVIMGLLYWIIGLLAGYYLTRSANPWIPLAMGGFALLTTQFFQPDVYRSSYLTGGYLFLFLIILSRVRYLKSHRRWEKQNSFEDFETGVNIRNVVLIFSVFLVLFAWNVPLLVKVLTPGTSEQQKIYQRFENVWEKVDNFFAPLRQRPVTKERSFGDVLFLGTGQPLEEDVLFAIITPAKDFHMGRYYWGARSYNLYENGLWKNSDFSEEIVEPDNVISLGIHDGKEQGRFIIVVSTKLGVFYSPREVISVNQKSKVLILEVGEDQREVIGLIPFTLLEEGDTYQVNAVSVTPTYEQLEKANMDFPDWVVNEYLQLPENFSPRIRELAKDITSGEKGLLNKTIAITEYLRREINYVTEIEDLPDEKDLIEWLLFESRMGFCNYYASAEVLMLRSIGIPARLVVGYAQGREIEKGKLYEVLAKDSHAWPEIYFPDIGWVIFEPTASQPQVEFPHEQISVSEDQQRNPEYVEIEDASDFILQDTSERYAAIEKRILLEEAIQVSELESSNYWIWVIWIIIIMSLLGLATFLLRGRITKGGERLPVPVFLEKSFTERGIRSPNWLKSWAYQWQLSLIERIFNRTDRLLKAFKNPRIISFTPKEKIDFLVAQLPETKEVGYLLLEEYHREIFNRGSANIKVARDSLRRIQRAAIKKRLNNIFNYLKNKTHFKSG